MEDNINSQMTTQQYLIDIWNIIRDIGTQSMWMGLIPPNMCKIQEEYYRSMGIRKTEKMGNGVDTVCVNCHTTTMAPA